MTEGQAIIIAARLLLPLLVVRWQLAGGIAAVLADGLDVVVVEFISDGGMGDHYHRLDKVLDTYYLALFAAVAWRWRNQWARRTALALFAYRLAGVALFEVTQARWVLFVFPNLFENWWFYCVLARGYWPSIAPTSMRTTATALVVLLVPKLAQEYLLHVAEAQPWNWTKEHLLRR